MVGISARAPSLEKTLSEAQLPALPQSAIQILELSRDDENGPAEFAAPIESDPGLAGQVLRFVNSSYFGFSREISSVKLAITLVGIRTIKNFILWNAVFSMMPNPRCGPFDLRSLWTDSLRRALFAREVTKLLGCVETEESFVAALLQDMAVPVLAKEASKQYAVLLEARKNGKHRLSTLEEALFGWTHAKAAGILARQWNLPEELAAMLESHHTIERLTLQPDVEPAKVTVAMSALLPAVVDTVWEESTKFEECYQKVCPSDGPSAFDLAAEVDREFAEFAPLLKLASPRLSLVDYFTEAAAVV